MYDCNLLMEGIVAVQFEAGDSSPEYCAYDEDVKIIRLRHQNRLAYGSTALVIVDPGQNDEQDALPVIVMQKGPRRHVKHDHSENMIYYYRHTMVYVTIYTLFETINYLRAPSNQCLICRRALTNSPFKGYSLPAGKPIGTYIYI